ncbi:hypothetical protein X943_000225 [Babesia divergens]|uniref:Nucleoporin NSP1-like C-terminal domain-containing protein n=1 Tax=Babesia divergens TaxID=32595 RepID=A0AAD9G6E3_BABDI|nr:hypothetical protein X943_000225 [Babesia divergens]
MTATSSSQPATSTNLFGNSSISGDSNAPKTTGTFGNASSSTASSNSNGIDTATASNIFGVSSTAKDNVDKSSTANSSSGLFGSTPSKGTTAGNQGSSVFSFGKPSTTNPSNSSGQAGKVTFSVTTTSSDGKVGDTKQEKKKLDLEFSITEQYNVMDLLDSWESRIVKKIESFKTFAEKVATIDRNLVLQSGNLNKLLNDYKSLIEKHEKMESAIKQMEEEQNTVLTILDTMERSLQSQLETVRNRTANYNTVQNITRQLQELNEQLSNATKDAENTAVVCQPEPLYTVAKVLSFHEASLVNLERQCNDIENRIKSMGIQ